MLGSLTELVLLVISARREPIAGIDIIRTLNQRGRGLYSVLDRAEKRGLLQSKKVKRDRGKPYRLYTITELGVSALAEAEKVRMAWNRHA